MAVNVCSLFSSDLGVGITGYASKIPELGINKLIAHVAIAAKSKILSSKKIITPDMNADNAKEYFTHEALKLLKKALIK